MAKSPKLYFIQFIPDDWTNDPVSQCSLAAQGLWLRMMIVAHHSRPYGHLAQQGGPTPPGTIAAKCGCSLEVYATLLDELDRHGVPSRTKAGVIYSRRMVRDYRQYMRNSRNGLKGWEAKQLKLKREGGLKPPLKPPLTSSSSSEFEGGGAGGGNGDANGAAGAMSVVELKALGAAVNERARKKGR